MLAIRLLTLAGCAGLNYCCHELPRWQVFPGQLLRHGRVAAPAVPADRFQRQLGVINEAAQVPSQVVAGWIVTFESAPWAA
jgi:hypothetical protein